MGKSIIIFGICLGILLLCFAVVYITKKESFDEIPQITISLNSVGLGMYNREKRYLEYTYVQKNEYLDYLNFLYPKGFQIQVVEDNSISYPYVGKINVELDNMNKFEFLTENKFWEDLYWFSRILYFEEKQPVS